MFSVLLQNPLSTIKKNTMSKTVLIEIIKLHEVAFDVLHGVQQMFKTMIQK